MNQKDTALVVIDVQEKLFYAMSEKEKLGENLVKMVKSCRILDIPIFFFEQNKQGLGSTISELQPFVSQENLFHKKSFSVKENELFFSKLDLIGIKTILICGIESHICVFQSAITLNNRGYEIHLILDCISSRRLTDRNIAESRLALEGVYPSSSEMILFEIMKTCEHKSFKQILSVIK